ncbi:MAG: hypothetical protein JWP08_4346 [Bryobacterales bacterium]|nr:hypothetical protein [Bryobacterales bacterium]
MIPRLRQEFNAHWTPALYAHFLRELEERSRNPVAFRISETPVFLPAPLVEKMARYGKELYRQLAGNRRYREAAINAIPPEFRVPNEAAYPLFVQADFGLVREADGSLEPKLVEIQGFPSIYAFQCALAETYRDVYRLDPRLRSLFGVLTDESYRELLRRTIVGEHAPENVVLLEIDPYNQKTSADFLLTQEWTGIRIADVSKVEKRGRKLFLDSIPIERIYNRVIVDELVRKKVPMAFSFADELEVEWAGHPNWFFLLSKFSLPWFDHVSVPHSCFLSDLGELPENLDEYVLKPLYSFAGRGVKIAPSREEIDAIAPEERGSYILQRKLDFVPTIETPSGMTKAEIRVMYIFDGELKPVTTILRTGRGKMMGVDFNKDLDWVGASAGFISDWD